VLDPARRRRRHSGPRGARGKDHAGDDGKDHPPRRQSDVGGGGPPRTMHHPEVRQSLRELLLPAGLRPTGPGTARLAEADRHGGAPATHRPSA
jgi:hypothetical protein